MVLTEADLPNDTEYANLSAVYCYRASTYSNDAVRQTIYERLVLNEPAHVNPLVESIAHDLDLPFGVVNGALFHMLWHCELETDWQKLLFIESRPARNAQIWLLR